MRLGPVPRPVVTPEDRAEIVEYDPEVHLMKQARPRTVEGTLGEVGPVEDQTEYDSFVATLAHDTDTAAITHVKQSLAARERNQRAYAIHCKLGHVGNCSAMGRRCAICQELRRSHRFIWSKIDPHISDIPMHYITMDSIYLKPTSRWGSNYAVVSRDTSSC
jgi:hypothetical protein